MRRLAVGCIALFVVLLVWSAPGQNPARRANGDDVPLIQYVERILKEKDLRDEQRFAASSEALKAALAAQEKAVAAALAAAADAVKKAEEASNKRFESVNELRGMANDIGSRMMPRLEADTRLRSLEARLDRQEGNAGGLKAGWAYLGAGIGMLLGIVSLYFALSKPRAAK